MEWGILDAFAGGGGASTGFEMALGRSPDWAINHNAEALAMHEANHRWSQHFKTGIWEIDPWMVTRGTPVGAAWFSPDCTQFSKAKGGAPIRLDGCKSRALAWVVVKWARKVRPRVIFLENVEEFQDAGPVIPKVDSNGRPTLDAKGDPWYVPCPTRKGQLFKRWVRELEKLGYRVEWRQLRACDYGSPTIRKRLFLIARCDGEPIVWPAPTHGKPDSPEVLSGQRLPWRTAADIIDWTLPCPSIFLNRLEGRAAGVNRPLKKSTMDRIFKGLDRYVLRCKKPFVVSVNHGDSGGRREYPIDEPFRTVTTSLGEGVVDPLLAPFVASPAHSTTSGRGKNHWSPDEPLPTQTASNDKCVIAPVMTYGQHGGANRSADDSMHTITASPKDQNAVIAPILDTYHNPRPDGTVCRSTELSEPLRTVDTQNRHALVEAFIAQHNGGMIGHRADVPLSTMTQRGTQQNVVQVEAVAAAFLSHLYTSNTQGGQGDPDQPSKTVTAGGQHHAAVMAFLQAYYGSGAPGHKCDSPFWTVTAKERLGLVTINEVEYMIVDIGMRMLTARELFRAQGFPADYKIDVWCDDRRNKDGKPLKPGYLTKEAQVRCAGNSVCPQVAAALIGANCPWLKVDIAKRPRERNRVFGEYVPRGEPKAKAVV